MSKTPENCEKSQQPETQMAHQQKQHLQQSHQPWRGLSEFSFEWREFLCGWSAAFFNIALTYPIHKMIFRQMLHGVPFASAFHQLRTEGVGYLYRGILPPLAQKTISLSIMFGVYDGSRRILTDQTTMGEYSVKCLAGLISGSLEAALLPFERVQTLLSHQKYHTRFRNMPDCFRYVYVNHGAKELFRGMTPVLFRNGPSSSIFFLMREEAAYRLPKHKSVTLRTAQEFTSGAIIGGTLSALFYPLNVIKVLMQSEMGHPYENIFTAAKRIYMERGFSIQRVYRGCAFNAMRASVSWGVTNTAYENVKNIVYKL